PYWGASAFVIQKLRELHQYGWEHLEQTAVKPAPYLGRRKIYTTPSNGELLRWIAPAVFRLSVRRLKQRWLTAHWRLAIRNGGRSIPDSDTTPDLTRFRWIESPKGRFYADPFLTTVGGRHWLFFEDFDYAANRGRICCAEILSGMIGETIPA